MKSPPIRKYRGKYLLAIKPVNDHTGIRHPYEADHIGQNIDDAEVLHHVFTGKVPRDSEHADALCHPRDGIRHEEQNDSAEVLQRP